MTPRQQTKSREMMSWKDMMTASQPYSFSVKSSFFGFGRGFSSKFRSFPDITCE